MVDRSLSEIKLVKKPPVDLKSRDGISLDVSGFLDSAYKYNFKDMIVFKTVIVSKYILSITHGIVHILKRNTSLEAKTG